MKQYWVGGLLLVGLGVLIGVIGQRTLWFGLARQHLRVDDCQVIALSAPYEAWHLTIRRDGSAVIAQGMGPSDFDVGFSGSNTEVRLNFPAGTFDFPTLCRELLGKRQKYPQGLYLDYPDMSWRLAFGPGPDWHNPAKRDEYRHEETIGFLAPVEGQKVIESLRARALELNVWDKRLEDLWPYPPIPWGFQREQRREVPGKLRVQLPVKIQQSWEGFLRDEKLQTETPPNGYPIGNPSCVGFLIDDSAWAKLWSAWRGEEKLPKVDFEKNLVLVFSLRNCPKLQTPLMPLDGNGNLTASAGGGGWEGRGFSYLLCMVRRDGIKSVNKMPLERK